MQLEDFFDVVSPDDIRIKGTRIGIETVLEDYLNGSSPKEIAVRYRHLSLGQVYVTITYYLCSRERIDQYLHEWRQYTDEAAQAQDRDPSDVVKRLRQLKTGNMPVRNVVA